MVVNDNLNIITNGDIDERCIITSNSSCRIVNNDIIDRNIISDNNNHFITSIDTMDDNNDILNRDNVCNDDCIVDSNSIKTKKIKTVNQIIKPCIFIKPNMMIKYIINANNTEGQEIVKLPEIVLKYGRTYFINLDISKANTGGENITFIPNKKFIDIIDIRSITNGIATIIPLRNNIKLKNGDNICLLIYKIIFYE